MINPSEVNISTSFVGSSFGKFEREVVARDIVVMSMVGAFVHGEDSWFPFTLAAYDDFRQGINNPISRGEHGAIRELVERGFLEEADDGQIRVTDQFLGALEDLSTNQPV